jgi:general secretion pathway protein L
MDDKTQNLTLAGLWHSLATPVLVLAEEVALRRAAVSQPPMLLRVRSGGIDATRVSGASREVLLSAAGRPQQALKEIVQRLPSGIGQEVALSFAADQSISQQLVLPQQPDDVLRAIVRNKVESLAPWPLAQCLWGMRAAAIAGDPQHVSVEVAVVSRGLLDELAATLRQAGADVEALTVELPGGDELEIALGAGDIRREARARAVRWARTAAVLAVVLLGLASFWIYRTAAEAARLDAETSALMASLKPNGVLVGETPLVTAANRIYQARRDRLPAVAIVEEVSKLLPETVHLVGLSLDGEQLTIKGQGSGVPGLIQILEGSAAFQGVNFAAATELDQNSNADAFSLVATLDKAPLQGAAP